MLNSTDKLLVMRGSSPGCLNTCTPVSKCPLHTPVEFSTCKLIIGPAFVDTLFAVTHSHHLYSTEYTMNLIHYSFGPLILFCVPYTLNLLP